MRSLLTLSLGLCEWALIGFAAMAAFCAWKGVLLEPVLAAITATLLAGLVRGMSLRRAASHRVDILFGGILKRNDGGQP